MKAWRVFIESAGPNGEPYLQAISVQTGDLHEQGDAVDKALGQLVPPAGFTPQKAYALPEPEVIFELRRRAQYERGGGALIFDHDHA